VRVHSKARDGACDGARLADAARRGAVDIANQLALGVLPGFKQEACKARWQQDRRAGVAREDGRPTTTRQGRGSVGGVVVAAAAATARPEPG
jgi:hypothetical protein